MEVIRRAPGRIFATSNVNRKIHVLNVLAALLLLGVCGVCVYAILLPDISTKVRASEDREYYYSLQEGGTACFEYLNVNSPVNYAVPEYVEYEGKKYPVTTISANAFTNRTTLKKITLPKSVTVIAEEEDDDKKTGAFAGCVALEQIVGGENLTKIGKYTFKNCANLVEFTFQETMEYVGEGAFQNCLSLETITITGNPIFSTNCFSGCGAVKELRLGAMVDTAFQNTLATFAEVSNIETISVAPANTVFKVKDNCLCSTDGEILYLGTAGAEIPASVTNIRNWAFANRYQNTDIFLDDTKIQEVAVNAFTNGVIYTPAATKPTKWKTNLTVRCQAQAARFYANETDSVGVLSYTYNNGTSFPEYAALFGELGQDCVFYEWAERATGEYQAVIVDYRNLGAKLAELAPVYNYAANTDYDYESNSWLTFRNNYQAAQACYQNQTIAPDELATLYTQLINAANSLEINDNKRATALTQLNSTLSDAEATYSDIKTIEVLVKYPVALWENFVSVYFRAKALATSAQPTAYALNKIRGELLEVHGAVVNYSTTNFDWRESLSELLQTISDKNGTNVKIILDKSDYVAGSALNTAWENLYSSSMSGWLRYENNDTFNGPQALQNLRKHYESLPVNLVPLLTLINKCLALNPDDYTPASWELLANQLAKAQKMTEKNRSVSLVRQNLQAAYDGLISKHAAALNELIAECDKLKPTTDYIDSESFDTILSKAKSATTGVDKSQQYWELLAAKDNLVMLKPELSELKMWISLCEDLPKIGYQNVSDYTQMLTRLTAANRLTANSRVSEVTQSCNQLRVSANRFNANIIPAPETGNSSLVITPHLVPYFIAAAVLLTLAIVCIGVSTSLKRIRH